MATDISDLPPPPKSNVDISDLPSPSAAKVTTKPSENVGFFERGLRTAAPILTAVKENLLSASKGMKLGGQEIGIAGQQIMSGGKSTPEQVEKLKQIEQQASKLPISGRAMRYAPEALAAVPAAFAVPEIGTAGALAGALSLGGLSSAITKPVTTPTKNAEEFLKEKAKQFKTGAEETGLGFGVGLGISALPEILRTAGRAVVGTTQPEISELAKNLEKEGYKFEPAQLRKDQPLGSPGFSEKDKINNENIVTKKASKETGVETENITPAFLKERQDQLGKDYDQIFNRNFTIDSKLVNQLEEMKSFEARVNPAGVGQVRATANNIINRWNDEVVNQQLAAQQRKITNVLQQQGRGGVSPLTRLRKDWVTLRDSTAPNIPAWMPEVEKTVNELSSSLGLKVTPKVWVSAPRRESLFGMATGDGHIIINDGLDLKGAVATALHEFGHQAEFQLLVHAPQETQREIYKAFREQMSKTPVGKLTVEQHRPLTAEKYGETRTRIPQEGFEKSYLRDFSEWFAEQTSRWITTTKTPTTVVEKFFKNIADSWKAVYQRVVGHLPMVQEVDNFFRSNWNGDLIQKAVAEGQNATKAHLDSPIVLPGFENVTAKIDGKELQRLRSNLTKVARTSSNGEDRRIAGEFVKSIDESIGRYDPQTLDKLLRTNRKYAATSVLGEGIEKGFVKGGKISPQGLGKHLANNTYGFGTGTSQHPLYDLGYAGQALNMRSRAEGVEYPGYDAIAALIGRSKQAVGSLVGTRSQLARSLQRKLTEKELENK